MKLEMVTTNTAIDGLAARAYDEDGRYVPFWYTQVIMLSIPPTTADRC